MFLIVNGDQDFIGEIIKYVADKVYREKHGYYFTEEINSYDTAVNLRNEVKLLQEQVKEARIEALKSGAVLAQFTENINRQVKDMRLALLDAENYISFLNGKS